MRILTSSWAWIFLFGILMIAFSSMRDDQAEQSVFVPVPVGTTVPTAYIISRPEPHTRDVFAQPTEPEHYEHIPNTEPTIVAHPPESVSPGGSEVPTAYIISRPPEQNREVFIPTPAAGSSENP